MESQIIEILLQRGYSYETQSIHQTILSEQEQYADAFKDVNKYPHIFILGCIGDKQMDADRAWRIPVTIASHIHSLDWDAFSKVSLDELISIFETGKLHRYSTNTAKSYYEGIQRIKFQYGGDASKIWADSPSSSLLVRRFLKFHGIGVKIATMAANILVRDYKIPVRDKHCIDVSPDTHVMRVFKRTGLVEWDAPKAKEEVIYKAREISPEYPGILDYPMFEIGRNFCFAKSSPNCMRCPLNQFCPKIVAKP